MLVSLTLKSLNKNELHEHLGRGQLDLFQDFCLDTIHPIDVSFGTYDELPLNFQLSVSTLFLSVSMATIVT